MQKNRLEAFSDGVIAIIITIMVLELKIPHGDSFDELKKLLPKFLSYVISFIYIAIYWNNHHHLIHTIKRVNAPIMWTNTHLLFWLSLVPFVTAWAGENNFSVLPVATYGVILFMTAVAYFILTKAIIFTHGDESVLGAAVGKDFKGKISVLLYAIAIPIAFFEPYISTGIYILVAIVWLIPDKRIEKKL
ncbi:MAG TPA: hypothetical protein DIW31_05370 [Bacteroidales bacterium]|nr:hypothetical protein [Bacteroidales bacterium]